MGRGCGVLIGKGPWGKGPTISGTSQEMVGNRYNAKYTEYRRKAILPGSIKAWNLGRGVSFLSYAAGDGGGGPLCIFCSCVGVFLCVLLWVSSPCRRHMEKLVIDAIYSSFLTAVYFLGLVVLFLLFRP